MSAEGLSKNLDQARIANSTSNVPRAQTIEIVAKISVGPIFNE